MKRFLLWTVLTAPTIFAQTPDDPVARKIDVENHVLSYRQPVME